MRVLKLFIGTLLILSLLNLITPGRPYAIYGLKNDRINIAVARLDYDSKELKGYYAFSQPLYLSLPEPSYIPYGLYFHKHGGGTEEQYFSARCANTGGEIYFGNMTWGGYGIVFFPDPEIFWPSVGFGYSHAAPDTIIASTIQAESPSIGYNVSEAEAQDIWMIIRTSDFVARIASNGKYSVLVFKQMRIGAGYVPITRDWEYVAIVNNIPAMPEEIVIAGMESPPQMLTANVPVSPEVRLLNRGNKPEGGTISLSIRTQNHVWYEDVAVINSIPTDSFRIVSFKPFAHSQSDSLDFYFRLSAGVSADSAWTQSVQVVADPVFKGHSLWNKAGGAFPPAGKLYGPNKDGLYDILTKRDYINYLKNLGGGEFIDFTANFTPEELNEMWTNGIKYRPRDIQIGDINNDGLIDSVWTGYSKPRVYLRQESGELRLEQDLFNSVDGAVFSIIFDYNQDGINDILFLRGHSSPAVLLRGDGNLEFTDVTSEAGPLPGAILGDAGDLNGDGYPDLILAYRSEIFLLMNREGKSFADQSYLLTTKHKYINYDMIYADYLRIIDLDGDGDNDIFGETLYFANIGFSDASVSIKTKDTPKLPSKYNLHAAYPNPFNPSATIRFDVPEAGKVRIVIYNVLGQRVAELVNENLAPGNYQRIWNASRFGSGIYFVRMEAPDFVKTQKVTFMK